MHREHKTRIRKRRGMPSASSSLRPRPLGGGPSADVDEDLLRRIESLVGPREERPTAS